MVQKSELGKIGEDLACAYLVEKRYRIIERNFREKWGELDVVAVSPDKTLVFVEVKTMKNNFRQELRPEDQMTSAKLKKFKRTASLYVGRHEDLIQNKKGWRLDLIAIEISNSEPPISSSDYIVRHYENIT